MSERYRDRWYKWKVVACLLWGIPFAAVGLLLCVTIVFAPVGLLALTVAGMPLKRQQIQHLKRKRAWIHRDRPMETEAIPPWLMEDELLGVEPDA